MPAWVLVSFLQHQGRELKALFRLSGWRSNLGEQREDFKWQSYWGLERVQGHWPDPDPLGQWTNCFATYYEVIMQGWIVSIVNANANSMNSEMCVGGHCFNQGSLKRNLINHKRNLKSSTYTFGCLHALVWVIQHHLFPDRSGSCSAYSTECLSCPIVMLDFQIGPRKLQMFWSTLESWRRRFSNHRRNGSKEQDRWIVHWDWRQAGKKQKLPSSMSFAVGGHQRVWPRLRVGLPTAKDPVRRLPCSSAQLLGF